MPRTITIDPVTRIEGHARITIQLDARGEVAEARFHVAEFRGFERFCVGRPLAEMAGLTARICGICPVSHVLASARAGDAILAVEIPTAARLLRRLMNLGQFIQSHALSFFHLSAPDLLLGMDADPSQRNIFGLASAEPDLARGGIRLRQFGQEIIEALGGRKIHPAWAVPGGVRSALDPAARDRLRARIPEARDTALAALARFKSMLDRFRTEIHHLGEFHSLFLAMVSPTGQWEHTDGHVRIVDPWGLIVADELDPARYMDYIGEQVEPWSYMKFSYYRPRGYPDGLYRVGPLARLNVCSHIGTPLADAELHEYRQRAGRIVNASFYYHYARLIEILAAVEQVERLLANPAINDGRLRASAGINRTEGVGASEAPRGTLFHHYKVDERGIITGVNLLIATSQNNLAINQTVTDAARHYLHHERIEEPLLNRIEAGVRAYDPCLSCSTHALGQMPLEVVLVAPDGTEIDRVAR